MTSVPGRRVTAAVTALLAHPRLLALDTPHHGQLSDAPGLVGYSLDAHLFRKTFWTLSAWTGQDAMEAFVRADPHAEGMAAIRPHMAESTFVFWTVTAGELPVTWDEARRRIEKRRQAPGPATTSP